MNLQAAIADGTLFAGGCNSWHGGVLDILGWYTWVVSLVSSELSCNWSWALVLLYDLCNVMTCWERKCQVEMKRNDFFRYLCSRAWFLILWVVKNYLEVLIVWVLKFVKASGFRFLWFLLDTGWFAVLFDRSLRVTMTFGLGLLPLSLIKWPSFNDNNVNLW